MARGRRKVQTKAKSKTNTRASRSPVSRSTTDAAEIATALEPERMKDAVIEEALLTGEHSGLLEDYFGPAQYAELRTLAKNAAVGVRSGKGDRVLILPGIMGSKLGYPRKLVFDDTIWLDPLQLMLGRITELRIARDRQISALGVILFAYLKLKFKLRISGHDAEFFPFDWRLSLIDLGRALAADIKQAGRRTHIVGHSMGGLVARAALLQKPDHVGRIIMLGTPNLGSFSPVLALRGKHSIVRALGFIDTFHSAADVAGFLGAFPGLCQMIPSPAKYPADYFRLSSWPGTGPLPLETTLKEALKAQARLPTTYEDAVVIAGIDRDTVIDARVENDEFVYTYSTAGDGTVPLDSAHFADAKHTYYVAEDHGSLANNSDVCRAIDSILATGETSLLPTQYRPDRAFGIREVRESDMVDPTMAGNRGRALSAREKRIMIAAFAAPDRATETAALAAPSSDLPAPSTAPDGVSNSVVVGRRRQQRLDITLAFGSITEAEAGAYVIGLFESVPPSGAASAIDERMNGAIGHMYSRRMFGASVGEISILPTGKHPLRADVIAFAGLGSFDRFDHAVLEIVGENLVRTFINTRTDDFAMVPIGGSTSAFDAAALRYLLTGFLRGLQDADTNNNFRSITICETDRERFTAIQNELYRLCGTSLFDGVEVTLRERTLPAAPPMAAVRGAAETPSSVFLVVRQEFADDKTCEFSCSVLTAGSKAAVFKNRQILNKAELDQHLAKLGQDATLTESGLPPFGKKLAEIILPDSIRTILAREIKRPFVIVHDAATSRIPWETLQIDGHFPAIEGGLCHRYEAENLSIAKWLEERQRGTTLNVLLIVNPTEDLPGAQAEGDRIETLLGKFKPSVKIQKLDRGEARKNEILKCISSGQYDLIHYAGHAYFDTREPARSGIMCSDKVVLSGADLANVGGLPSLVFFNACESGRLRRGSRHTEVDDNVKPVDRVQRGVSFAEAFLRGGIANYLGTYWPVGDAAALTFAEVFYQKILARETLGSAIMAGRKAVQKTRSADWADYIFYGDPQFALKI